jgi:alpha-amylase
MGVDVDLQDEKVYEQLVKWGKWYLHTTGVNGLRLDALKHMSRDFYQHWLTEMRASVDHELFVVGEYWTYDVNALRAYLGEEESLSLFDVPLHFNFFNASQNGDAIDFRHIFDGSLVAADPIHAVTFVENHDTQPDQALESTVLHWFKPAAYAMILLREAGYPCVFFADLYGLPNDGIPAVAELPLLMEIRMEHAFGEQRDYFDEADLVGWTREGSDEGSGCAVVLSRRDGGEKTMEVGARHAGEQWRCVLGEEGAVEIDEKGFGVFPAAGSLVSVYLPEEAAEALSNIPIIVPPNRD